MKTALILVDLQYDFAHPAGALYVYGGKDIIGLANKLMPCFEIVVATKDCHPPDHCSFAENHPGKEIGQTVEVEGLSQMLWPVHCVENTPGAAIHLQIDLPKIDKIIRKGTNTKSDSYSAFFNSSDRYSDSQQSGSYRAGSTELERYLRPSVGKEEVDTLYVMGLATDYCVKYTVLDACELGFDVFVIEDGCRAVNKNDELSALNKMKQAGATIISSARIFEKVMSK